MNQPLAVAVSLLLAGCASASAPSPIPADAKRVIDRLADCTHFAGEINGDRSVRDKEVMATMTELRCHAIDSDVAAIRKKYAGNRLVQEALDAASEL